MSLITASIVLYNTPQSQLDRLLKSIEDSSVGVRVYLVDNSPEAMESAVPKYDWVTYIKADSNRGYGAGHNIALRRVIAESDYHFVLNPDISFGPEELGRMIEFMESDSTIGQLMPKVVYPDGSIQWLCKLVPTPADLFMRRFAVGPLKNLAREKAEHFELRFTGYTQIMDIPYLSGCFMLFRTPALRKIGLFDERFFMYPEDIDITRRMHAEFRTVFFPGATIVHDHAKESYTSLRALVTHIWNIVKYFNKWGWFIDPERSKVNKETLDRAMSSSRAGAIDEKVQTQ